MDLVLQLNDQLKEMEKELDILIQLKQASLDYALATVIPTVTNDVPSTLAASLAPTAPIATTLLASTPSTSTWSTGDEANRLVKEMEEMSIQTTEMSMHKEKMTNLETDYKLAQIMHKEEKQKSTRMNEQIKSL